jgi:wobble nucleotide-excising tRNase
MKKDDRSFYMIERASNSQRDESYIKHLPVQLLKFKSEYSYLFSILLTYKTNPTQDFDQLYNLPNILRRFIETFTAFKYLSTRNIEENIERLIKNPVKCEQVRKFVHYYSHSLTTDRMMQFSDLTECTTVVDTVLDSVKALDIEHYDSLVAEVSIPNTTPVGTGANS